MYPYLTVSLKATVDTIAFRNLRDEDYPAVIAVMNDWWGGRPVAEMLPRLFFQHFQETSFAAVENGSTPKPVAFLVGFVSQTRRDEAYIHFVGVHPDFRKRGLARELYERFFEEVRARGCRRVRCVTSPANTGSVAFHKKMGFSVEPGDTAEKGTPATSNYDGRGHARVRFVKELVPTQHVPELHTDSRVLDKKSGLSATIQLVSPD
jgi:ribosomal protein S18 acetylase RimI-like enzyme